MDIDDYKDLPKKYVDTYIRVRRKDLLEWHTIYVEKITIDFSKINPVYHVFGKLATGQRNLFDSSTHEFSFEFPPLGVVNFEDSVIIASRFPARQWKKAACKENYQLFQPLHAVYKLLSDSYTYKKNTPFSWSTKNIDHLFTTKYYSLKEAKTLLYAAKKVAVAVNEDFFLTGGLENKNLLLWRNTRPVAELTKEGYYVFLPELKQEVDDFFMRYTHAN